MVTWKNPGTGQFTACKSTTENASLTNGRSSSVGTGNRGNSPQIGSAAESAEQINTWR
jgi:hypothetical protein